MLGFLIHSNSSLERDLGHRERTELFPRLRLPNAMQGLPLHVLEKSKKIEYFISFLKASELKILK